MTSLLVVLLFRQNTRVRFGQGRLAYVRLGQGMIGQIR